MPKFLAHIFGHKPTSNNVPSTAIGSTNGRLETDAAPVEDDDESNANNNLQQPITAIATPTASADMTADMVRELSDPNYNSLDLVPGGSSALATTNTNNSMSTSNTMNVHNAQQQLVMQFSNVSQLHVGSVYNFNSNLSATNSRKSSNTDEASAAAVAKGFGGSVAGDGLRQTTRKTTSVVAMMQSQEEPNHRILDAVATHLGEGWRFVMRELGHSEGQIEQAIIDHQMHGGIKEVIYQLLLQWVRNADDGKATVACITSLLWEMNHRECVQRMKLVWKSNSKSKPFR